MQANGLGLAGMVFVKGMLWASLLPRSTFKAEACCLQECLSHQRMPHECEVTRWVGVIIQSKYMQAVSSVAW